MRPGNLAGWSVARIKDGTLQSSGKDMNVTIRRVQSKKLVEVWEIQQHTLYDVWLACVLGHCASLLSKTILFCIGSNNMGGGLQSNSTLRAVATCDRLRQLDKFFALASHCYCDQRGHHPGDAAKQSTTRMLEVYFHAGPPILTSERSF